jgi:hypothetical protein
MISADLEKKFKTCNKWTTKQDGVARGLNFEVRERGLNHGLTEIRRGF